MPNFISVADGRPAQAIRVPAAESVILKFAYSRKQSRNDKQALPGDWIVRMDGDLFVMKDSEMREKFNPAMGYPDTTTKERLLVAWLRGAV